MNVHHNRNGLTDYQRYPHGHVAVVSVQKFFHNYGKWNLLKVVF